VLGWGERAGKRRGPEPEGHEPVHAATVTA
jgi:hypothetical protein